MSIENLNQHDGLGGAPETSGAMSDGSESDFPADGEGQPKKQSPIVVFGLALAVLGGGYLWYARSGPAAAVAAANSDADSASQTVSSFLEGGTTSVQTMQKMLRDTEKVVQQFLDYPSMKQVPLGELQTNPFRFRPPTVEGDKPSETDAAAKRRREEERQVVLKAVGELNLQSVIHSGARKSCMINNTLYTEGQQIDTFVVEKINPGTIIVKSGVYRFELRMQK